METSTHTAPPVALHRLVRRCVSHHFACDCREAAFAELLKDVMQLHSTPNGAQYNECDTDPCAWCKEAKRLMFHGHPDATNAPDDRLLPCPFCGSAAKTYCKTVTCSNQDCKMHFAAVPDMHTPEEWNQRACDTCDAYTMANEHLRGADLGNNLRSELASAQAEKEKWEQIACDKLIEVCMQIEEKKNSHRAARQV